MCHCSINVVSKMIRTFIILNGVREVSVEFETDIYLYFISIQRFCILISERIRRTIENMLINEVV